MMFAAILTIILMVHCPLISAIPAAGHALSPLLQQAEQCTHALSTVVHLGDTTPWLEHISNVIHGQPVSDETSLIVYDTATTQTIHNTCPVSSKPSRPAIDVLLTIEGPFAVQASQVLDDSSITQHSSTDWITTAGSPQSTAIVLLTIDGPISIKAGGKGGLEPTLPNHLKLPICAATAFRGHSPINQTIIMADQPNLLSSEIETTFVPQGFRLAYLLHYITPIRFFAYWLGCGLLSYAVGLLFPSSIFGKSKARVSNKVTTTLERGIEARYYFQNMKTAIPAEILLTKVPVFSSYSMHIATAFFRHYHVRDWHSTVVMKHHNGSEDVVHSRRSLELVSQRRKTFAYMHLINIGNPYLRSAMTLPITDTIILGKKSSKVSMQVLNGCQALIRRHQPSKSEPRRLQLVDATSIVKTNTINFEVLVSMPWMDPISIGNKSSEVFAQAIKGCTDIIQWQDPLEAIFRRLKVLDTMTTVNTRTHHLEVPESIPEADTVSTCNKFLGTVITAMKAQIPVRKQVRKVTTMIQQPAVHIMDTKSFTLALECALQVPRYQITVFRLMKKYLNIDCAYVQQLVQERNKALHTSKQLEDCRSKDTTQSKDADIFHNAERQKYHNKWQTHYQTEIDRCAKLLEQTRVEWSNRCSAKQTEFDWQLHLEQNKTTAAQARVNVLQAEKSDLQHKLRNEESHARKLGDQLIKLRVSRKVDLEVAETKIQTYMDQCKTQKRVCSDLDSQVKSLEHDKHQVIMEFDGKLIQEKNNLEEAKSEIKHKEEVSQLLRERLQRKENSEAKKDSKISELTRQLEEDREARSELTTTKKENARLMQELHDLNIRIQSFETSEEQTQTQVSDLIREFEEINSPPNNKQSSTASHEPAIQTKPLPSELKDSSLPEAEASQPVHKNADSWDDDFYNDPTAAKTFIPSILEPSPAPLITGDMLDARFGSPNMQPSIQTNTKATTASHRSWPSISTTTSATLTEAPGDVEPACNTNQNQNTNQKNDKIKNTDDTDDNKDGANNNDGANNDKGVNKNDGANKSTANNNSTPNNNSTTNPTKNPPTPAPESPTTASPVQPPNFTPLRFITSEVVLPRPASYAPLTHLSTPRTTKTPSAIAAEAPVVSSKEILNIETNGAAKVNMKFRTVQTERPAWKKVHFRNRNRNGDGNGNGNGNGNGGQGGNRKAWKPVGNADLRRSMEISRGSFGV